MGYFSPRTYRRKLCPSKPCILSLRGTKLLRHSPGDADRETSNLFCSSRICPIQDYFVLSHQRRIQYHSYPAIGIRLQSVQLNHCSIVRGVTNCHVESSRLVTKTNVNLKQVGWGARKNGAGITPVLFQQNYGT